MPTPTAPVIAGVTEAHETLSEQEKKEALALYEKALAAPPFLGEVELLEEAIRVASKAGLPARASTWQTRLAVLKPPPPPDAKGGAK